jgi:hypothetical protein
MSYRYFAPNLIEPQLNLLEVVRTFKGATPSRIKNILEAETKFEALKSDLSTKSPAWGEIMEALEFFITAGFLITKWIKSELSGSGNPELELRSAKNNAAQGGELIAQMDIESPSVRTMLEAKTKIAAISTVTNAFLALESIALISLPADVSSDERKRPPFSTENQDSVGHAERPVVLSVLFYLEKELWANPQIIKPNYQYRIKGEIQLNHWPDGYTQLSLIPASTSEAKWYSLTIPDIKPFAGTKRIDGALVFNHAQASFDDHWTIKLLALLEGPGIRTISPEIVGYDELKVKVLSESSFPTLSKHPVLNEWIWKAVSEISLIMPDLFPEEREDFTLFLSGILNYQGHCAERGTYKGVSTLSEDEFRDKLIDFLDTDMRLVKKLVKEGELAGGRVELNYNGIIAELKVEKAVQDRQKIIEAHWRQPAAYASGAGKRLSILCILDLTMKKNPSATPINNIFFREPEFHGFETSKPEYPSRIAIVFIDGNLRRPSEL